jgi:hypothetical protein
LALSSAMAWRRALLSWALSASTALCVVVVFICLPLGSLFSVGYPQSALQSETI